MARSIYCPTCDIKMTKAAFHYNELYESIEGKAIKEMMCDSCGKNIAIGDSCFASVLLPDANHPYYHIQHPSQWKDEFIETKERAV